MPDDDTHYIECECHDLNHTSRIWFDNEMEHFYFEFKILRFPNNQDEHIIYFDRDDTWFSTLWKKIKSCIFHTWFYFCNIWRAILGFDLTFVGSADIGKDEIIHLIKFMISKLNLDNNDIMELSKFLSVRIDLPKLKRYEFFKKDNEDE